MISKRKLAVIALYKRGYRLHEDGTAYRLDGRPVRVREEPNGRLGIRCRVRGDHIDAIAWLHLLGAYQKYGVEVNLEDIVVRHRDGNCKNNALENLLLGSQHDNSMDRPREQRVKHAIIAAASRRRFTDAEVAGIREDRLAGSTLSQLSTKYGISKGHISMIVNFKIYNN